MTKVVVLSRRNITHPRAGGASRYVHEIFRRLARKYDIIVLSEGAPTSQPIQEIQGLTYINIQGSFLRLRLPLYYLRSLAKDTDILIDNADVAIPWLSPLFGKKPAITIVHQLVREIFYEELPRILAAAGYFSEPAIYRLYSRSSIVAMSNSTAQGLRELGIPDDRIRIIGPGCPYPTNERVPLVARSHNMIGCVSRLMRYKGVQFAIRSIAQIADDFPDIRLEIAGSGPYEPQLRKLAQDLKVDPKVTFLGRVSEERKLKLYRESRAIILSSIREGYGLSVIEANAFGTPAIGWDVPGLRDSIIDNETGLLASFPHEQDLARQIHQILIDDSTWLRMSERAWKWAHDHSWDHSAREFEDMIESVLHR
jgi:glycosyltransferase involved in cell wall biosynthesis